MLSSVLDVLAEELRSKKLEKAQLESDIRDLNDQIIAIAKQRGKKSVEATTADGKVRLTVVTSERLVWDDAAVKERLGKRFKKVRSDKVDPHKLEAALVKGIVTEEEVQECLTLTKSRPYLRSSVVGSTQQQDS